LEKDLIIGCCSNYSLNDLKPWINSIRNSGFTGDVVLTGTNLSGFTIEALTKEGIILSLYGEKDEDTGGVKSPSANMPHVERFFYMWNFLRNTETDYRFVITTDTRDVVFQTNPSTWLENKLTLHNMVCSSEGMRYENEPWGNQNLLDTFGPFFHNMLKQEMIYNVGTIAGWTADMENLFLTIFQMSINRPTPIVDQAVFNFIVSATNTSIETYKANNHDAWAIQLGTTLKAVEAGNGQLGFEYGKSPSTLINYKMLYEEEQPEIKEDGTVVNSSGVPFVMVHQYDRVPVLKSLYKEKYGQ